MLEGIIRAAREAGGIFRDARLSRGDIRSKEGPGNFVTRYDVEVQQRLRARLLALLPGAAFTGEEDEAHTAAHGADWRFIVDPIDGTRNFMLGYRHSAVSIGLVHKGALHCGVVYNPYLDEVFSAEKGKGAFCNGEQLHVSLRPLQSGIVLFGTSCYDRALAEPTFRLLRRLFDAAEDLRNTGSGALDICYVAAGRCDVFFELTLSPWDYAAGALILEEAGGRITTLGHKPIDLNAPCSILAASGAAYADILRLGLTDGIVSA